MAEKHASNEPGKRRCTFVRVRGNRVKATIIGNRIAILYDPLIPRKPTLEWVKTGRMAGAARPGTPRTAEGMSQGEA